MTKSLDEKIFDLLIETINRKKMLTEENIGELKMYLNKANVTAEDWDMLLEKECFHPRLDNKNGR